MVFEQSTKESQQKKKLIGIILIKLFNSKNDRYSVWVDIGV